MASYIWPLSKSTRPDKMNTSFGPRIDGNKWDFHDGIDLPAPIGANVYAMPAGIVHRAGIGHSSAGVTAKVYTDELQLTESSHYDENDAIPAPIMKDYVQEK